MHYLFDYKKHLKSTDTAHLMSINSENIPFELYKKLTEPNKTID